MKGWILACTIAQLPPSLLPPALPVQAAMLVSNVPVTPVRLLTFSVCCQNCLHIVRSVLEPFPCSTAGTSAGSVRLVGDSRSRGLVEVFYNGRWGPVCSSLWGTTEARLVCGELGFNRNDGSRYTSPG